MGIVMLAGSVAALVLGRSRPSAFAAGALAVVGAIFCLIALGEHP